MIAVHLVLEKWHLSVLFFIMIIFFQNACARDYENEIEIVGVMAYQDFFRYVYFENTWFYDYGIYGNHMQVAIATVVYVGRSRLCNLDHL